MQLSPGGSCRGTGSVWLCNSNHSLLIQFLLCYIISDVILQTRNIHWKCFSFVTWRTACYGWGQLLSWRLRSGLITACINSATRLGGNWFQQKHPHTSEAAWYCRRTERPPHTSPLQARLTSRLRADWLGVGACSWFEWQLLWSFSFTSLRRSLWLRPDRKHKQTVWLLAPPPQDVNTPSAGKQTHTHAHRYILLAKTWLVQVH